MRQAVQADDWKNTRINATCMLTLVYGHVIITCCGIRSVFSRLNSVTEP